MEINRPLANSFAALGDPTRMKIISALLDGTERNAGELHALSDKSPQSVSRHLKVLHEAGILDRRLDKQMRKYRINPSRFEEIHDWISEARAFWLSRMDKMAELIGEDEHG